MKTKSRLALPFIILSLVCLVVILVSCGAPTPPTPTETVVPPTATDTPTPTPPQVASVCVPVKTVGPETKESTNGFFVDNQMIVIGPSRNIDTLLNQVAVDGVVIQECNLNFLTRRSFISVAPPKIEGKEITDWKFDNPDLSDQEDRSSLVMRLYEFPSPTPIEQRIFEVNQSGNDQFVFADANYILSPSENNAACGLPNSGGGGGGGRLFGGPGILGNRDVNSEFMTQWALTRQGATLPASTTNGTGNETQGSKVRVGVFDTASLPVGPHTIPAQPIDLNLNVVDVITVPLSTRPNFLDVSDHGVFVSGLVHRVAPEDSEIQLIRVLNDEGCGTLFDISAAIQDFTNRMSLADGKEEGRTLDKVVMSLSLGVRRPTEVEKEENVSSEHPVDWKLLNDGVDSKGSDTDELVSLETAVYEANQMGAMIFAASGNDSADGLAQPMQLPADYDTVYGVAATNMQSDRSCYSNQGDIAAPGGDGGQNQNGASGSCVPRADTWNAAPPTPVCTEMASCQYGLVSLASRVTGGPGYIYWAGTSFSTPLVSGLAALTLQETGGNTRRAVCLIEEGALQHPLRDVRLGKIDIDYSLNNASCP